MNVFVERKVSPLFIIGIVLLPIAFAWFTLRKGYSRLARGLTFGWLVLSLVLIGNAPSPPTRNNTGVRKTDSASISPAISTPVHATRDTEVGNLDVTTDEKGTRFIIAGQQTSILEHVIGLGPTQKWYAGNWILAKVKERGNCTIQYLMLLVGQDSNHQAIIEKSNLFGDCSSMTNITSNEYQILVNFGGTAVIVAHNAELGYTSQVIEPDELPLAENRMQLGSAEDGMLTVLRPPIQPDNKVYRFQGQLESYHDTTDADGKPAKEFIGYVRTGDGDRQHFAGIASADVPIDQDLRIDGPIQIAGRYIANLDSTNLMGAPIKLPTLIAYDVSSRPGDWSMAQVSRANKRAPFTILKFASTPAPPSSAPAHAVAQAPTVAPPSPTSEIPTQASSPSFDCNKATTSIEQEICHDPLLSNLDAALSQNYAKVRSANFGFSEEEKQNISQAQKAWVTERDRCADAECLRSIYRKRIDELAEICDAAVISGVHPDCVSADSVR